MTEEIIHLTFNGVMEQIGARKLVDAMRAANRSANPAWLLLDPEVWGELQTELPSYPPVLRIVRGQQSEEAQA